jgi:hypothetical protein
MAEQQTANFTYSEKEMSETIGETITPFAALDFIRDNSEALAEAKANVLYLTEYRKSLKAMLMGQSDAKTESAKECYAYSNSDYINYIKALSVAVQEAERLRWLMVAAEAKISVWQTLQASARLEMKAVR